MKPIKIGLLGLGQLGISTYQVLARNSAEIYRRCGRAIQISHIAVKNPTKKRKMSFPDCVLTTDIQAIIDNPEIDMIVELMGGEAEAKQWICEALQKRKPVVTANKSLLALYGHELFQCAEKHGVMLAFESAIAGGLPIVEILREGLVGNCIHRVCGILNVGANTLLSAMAKNNEDFTTTLERVQKLSCLSPDPVSDIEGYDAGYKLALLASLAFGIPVNFNQIQMEGMADILPIDHKIANELGYVIKPLAIAKREGDGLELRVCPSLIPNNHLFAKISDQQAAIAIQSDPIGESFYVGPGVGSDSAASAVIADIIDIARTLSLEPALRAPALAFALDQQHDIQITDPFCWQHKNYLRIKINDHPGVLQKISQLLAESEINIENILQREKTVESTLLIFITATCTQAQIQQALAALNSCADVLDEVVRLRIEEL